MALNLIDLSDSGLADKKLHKEDNSSKVKGQWAKPGEIRLDKDKDKKNAQDGQFFFRQRGQHLDKTRYAPVRRQDVQEKDENIMIEIIIELKKKLHKVDNSSMVGQQWDKTRSCSWSPPGRRHDGQRKPLRSTTRAQMRERRAAQFSNCFLTLNCQNIQTQSFLEQSVPQKWLQRGLRLEIYSVLYIAHLYIVRTRWNF